MTALTEDEQSPDQRKEVQDERTWLEQYFVEKTQELVKIETDKVTDIVTQKVDREKKIIMGYLHSGLKKKAFARSVKMSYPTFKRICAKYPEVTTKPLSEAQRNGNFVTRSRYVSKAERALSLTTWRSLKRVSDVIPDNATEYYDKRLTRF